jgi:hypothetical protein
MVARQLDSRLRGEQTFANRAPRPLQLHHVSCRARAASNGRRASGWQSIGWGGLVAYAGLARGWLRGPIQVAFQGIAASHLKNLIGTSCPGVEAIVSAVVSL